jgi:HK97 gp10 family phage protein
MKVSVKFEGGKELADALTQLSTRVSKKFLREGLEEAAEPMRRRMETFAARGDPAPPNLRNEMVISSARGVDAQEVAVAVGPSLRAFYGSFVELGTAFQPARPFARPAFDETAPKVLGTLGAAIWRELAGRGINRPTVGGGAVIGGGGGGGLV